MSNYERTCAEAYERGYREGTRAARSRRDDGGRAGWLCLVIAMYACTAFAIVASILELFGLN